jgi:hypothetical protein
VEDRDDCAGYSPGGNASKKKHTSAQYIKTISQHALNLSPSLEHAPSSYSLIYTLLTRLSFEDQSYLCANVQNSIRMLLYKR